MSVDALFEEFVAAWTSGEAVDVAVLMARAGPGADELAGLVDAFLERAPRREPSDEAKQLVAELAARFEQPDPPLLAARVAARMKLRDVAAAIASACGLPAEAEKLVRDYYQRLELGLLDPGGVSARVWAVLERVLTPTAMKLAAHGYPYRPATSRPQAAFQRLADAPTPSAAMAPPVPDADVAPPSALEREVAALFIGQERD